MPKRAKCHYCDKKAIAYIDEGNGKRRFLCDDHMPRDDVDGDDGKSSASRDE
jgi:hypothetical protein